jgi:hypothetical protein
MAEIVIQRKIGAAMKLSQRRGMCVPRDTKVSGKKMAPAMRSRPPRGGV